MMTVCDGCPCLNTDYESGNECNLSFNIKYIKLNNKEWKTVSYDCELVSITTKDTKHIPARVIGEIDERK